MSTERIGVCGCSCRVLLALPLIFTLLDPATVRAQSVFFACHVPLTGTVYRIREATLKTTCTPGHVEFNWMDGANALRVTDAGGGDLSGVFSNATVVRLLGRALSSTPPQAGQVLTWNGTEWVPTTPTSGGGSGVSDHGALSGLGDDDHLQYLLINGARHALHGFAVTGTHGQGAIAVSGPGTRLLWYPNRSAFRAGRVFGEQWDDLNIGFGSVAMGTNTIATASDAVAFGNATEATGSASTAFGEDARASGHVSVAFGESTRATGDNSTAMGFVASTNNQTGAFVYADRTSVNVVAATRANQFVVRAQHFWLGTNNGVANPAGHFLTTSTGAFLSTGGTWTNVSDVALKNAFGEVDSDDVLNRIVQLPIRSWSYKAEDASVRHVGPTAQDFRAAFGLGNADTSIATVDADGISLLGIQALEKRTRELERDNQKLRVVNAELQTRLDKLEAALKRLENR